MSLIFAVFLTMCLQCSVRCSSFGILSYSADCVYGCYASVVQAELISFYTKSFLRCATLCLQDSECVTFIYQEVRHSIAINYIDNHNLISKNITIIFDQFEG